MRDTMKTDMRCLAFPLPEDILKREYAGDFEGAERVIRKRLEGTLPDALRERLNLELESLPVLLENYPVTQEEAWAVLTENLRDFSPEELEIWRDEDLVDWIFVNGEIRYISSFYENLIKTRPELARRQLHPPEIQDNGLDALLAQMRKQGGLAAHIRMEASIGLISPEPGRMVRAWLPLPVEEGQIRHVRLTDTSVEPAFISGPHYPQRTVYFEVPAEKAEELKIAYEFDAHMPYIQPDPEAVSSWQPAFYTQEEAPHIVFTPYMRRLAAELQGTETNPLKTARRFYDFITTQVKYSFMRSYSVLPNIPEYCASRLRGDCGVQALTFITMCRIAGIPARWQSGLHAGPAGAGCHDWAMFYVAPFGWMYCDPSWGGSAYRAGAMERWNHYFCNLDTRRVVLATEFQTPFDPPTQFSRRDPYDNQDGEIEYAHRRVSRKEQVRTVHCLEFQPQPFVRE